MSDLSLIKSADLDKEELAIVHDAIREENEVLKKQVEALVKTGADAQQLAVRKTEALKARLTMHATGSGLLYAIGHAMGAPMYDSAREWSLWHPTGFFVLVAANVFFWTLVSTIMKFDTPTKPTESPGPG